MEFILHIRTDSIILDRRACAACGNCVTACRKKVLGLVSLFGFHRHAHVNRAEECIGCLACVRACPGGAILAVERNRQ